jgi:endonuclease/exonuclease/phosphatase (EEP) superfamily protein YafD
MKLGSWKEFPDDRPLDRVLTVSLWVYVVSLLVWLITRSFVGDESIFVLGFSYLGVWLFVPLLVFGPWIFRKRSKPGFILLAIPVGLFLWFYGWQFVPKASASAVLKKPLSVLTFNLLNTNPEIEALIDVLNSRQVDVLTLQEVSRYQERQLSAALSRKFPHRWYYPPDGLAIYSAHPITNEKIYPAQPWAIQSVILDVGGTAVHIINAHLAKPGFLLFLETWEIGVVRELAAERLDQIVKIKQAVADNNLPTIVNCDCNMTNLTSAYTQMASVFQDASKNRGWGLGHTFLLPRGFDLHVGVNIPVQRIDYIFSSQEIMPAKVEVVRGDSGSDHRPVWALVDINP